jgi:hypothetical protein
LTVRCFYVVQKQKGVADAMIKAEEKFQGTKTELGPGMYLNVKDHGINDNSISSMRLVGSPTAR